MSYMSEMAAEMEQDYRENLSGTDTYEYYEWVMAMEEDAKRLDALTAAKTES